MSLRDFFLGSRPGRTLEHALFGTIRFTPGRGWENDNFELWGFRNVQLLIDAAEAGPTPAQEAAFRQFLADHTALLSRLREAVAAKRAETGQPPGIASVSALSIPALDGPGPNRTGHLWTIWFVYDGEDHWSYGVQTQDGWNTLSAFAED